jgi:hypothetical protein
VPDIFDFWSQIRRGEKIHPADKEMFRRIDPKKHGFELKCLPACFAGPLRTAPLVLLYLSPGFREEVDFADAKTNLGKDYYFRRWQGNEPLRAGHKWTESRTKCFGKYDDLDDIRSRS